ncbi:MAG TPA: PAS domain S-box protein, partial [Myxococcales bacterium]|nr:PAS domain S-box protein [Myxococcales bacterium]
QVEGTMSDSATQQPLQADLRLAIDTIKDYAIFLLDPSGIVRSWNRGAQAIKGYSEAEIVGSSFTRFYPPEDVQSGKPARFLERAQREGRAQDQGFRVRKDGSRFWAEVTLTAVRDDAGELRGYVKVTRDLSEQRAADERLRASEEKLRLLVGSVKDYAIFMLNPQGQVTTWNTGAESIKGYAPDEIIGRHVSTFYTPEDVEAGKPARLLGMAMRHGRVEDEGWRVRKNGTRFWADVVITRVDDPQGNLVGFAKVTRDLTSRREAESALRQSEERLRLMIESVKDYAIFMLDPAGYVVSWNPGAERVNGYKASEIVGRHFSRFYPPEDAAAGKPQIELDTARATGRFEEEGWRVRKDGSRFWSTVVLTAVYDDHGTLVGFAKVTRDMTERKRAEEATIQRARQQAAIAQLGLFALEKPDVANVMRRAIDTTREILGTELVNVLELSDDGASLVLRASSGGNRDVGRVVSELERGSQPGYTVLNAQPVPLDRTRFTPGSFLDAEGAGSGITALIGAPARPHGAFGVLAAHSTSLRDFTMDDVNFLQTVANVIAAALERVRMEEQVLRAEQKTQEERVRTAQAREALRERDEFISVAAHELRTPLTALQLKVQGLDRVIRTSSVSEAGAKGMTSRLEGALRQIERLASLVERLLDVSRIAGGRLELAAESFDAAALLRQIADDFREPAAAAGAEIHVEAPAELMVQWDRLRIEQVLVNLLANAVKYGRGRPVHIRLDGARDRVHLEIADEGIGIAPEDVERIFTRFGRAAPVRNYGGLGLGLYIVKHIVEAHGGTIDVSSHLGRGSTFVIDLPVVISERLAAEGDHLQARA